MKEGMKITGTLKLTLFDKDGKVKKEVELKNTLTNLFDAHVADQMSDQGEAVIGYIGVGTGSGQGAGSTGLATPLARVALTSTAQGTGANDNDVIYTASFVPGAATGTITEAGILRLDDNASLMAYNDSIDPISKGAGDTLGVTWTITFGAS